jgi:hypothetical protein
VQMKVVRYIMSADVKYLNSSLLTMYYGKVTWGGFFIFANL